MYSSHSVLLTFSSTHTLILASCSVELILYRKRHFGCWQPVINRILHFTKVRYHCLSTDAVSEEYQVGGDISLKGPYAKRDIRKIDYFFQGTWYALKYRSKEVERESYRISMRKLPTFYRKVTMFATANAIKAVWRRSLEALRLQPLGKPPQCFS